MDRLNAHRAIAIAALGVLASCGSTAAHSGSLPDVRQHLFAVLEWRSPQGNGPDTIAIVGRDGHTRAEARFVPQTPPKTGCAMPFMPIQAYVTAGKAFYLDGRGVIRSLTPSGTVSLVGTLPISSSQQEATFAVSTSGEQIMGTVWTFPDRPSPYQCQGPEFSGSPIYQQDVYAIVAGQAAQRLQHESWSQDTSALRQPYPHTFLEFIGWDSLGPIGVYNATYQSQGGGGGPWKWLGDPYRVLPSGLRGASLDDSSCKATDIETNGFVCIGGPGSAPSMISVRNPDGSEFWHTQQDTTGYSVLSPARRSVALLDVVISRDGRVVALPKSDQGFGTFTVAGWLDEETLVGWIGQGEMATLAVTAGAQPRDLGRRGDFVGHL